jgi:hypothetical protein
MMVACKYKTLLIITDTTVTANGLNFVNFQNKIRVTGRANRTSKTRIAMLKLLAWGLAGFSALLAISQTVQSIINKSRSVTSLILLSKQTVGGECDAPAYCPRYRHRIYWHSDNELTDYEDNVLKAISRRAAANVYALHSEVSLVESIVVQANPYANSLRESTPAEMSHREHCTASIHLHVTVDTINSTASASAQQCHVHLRLQRAQPTHGYDERDIDSIYRAVAHTTNCLRILSGLPLLKESSLTNIAQNITTSDRNLHVDGEDVALHRQLSLANINRETKDMLRTVVQLYGLDESWWSALRLRGNHRQILVTVDELLQRMSQVVKNSDVGASTSHQGFVSGTATRRCIVSDEDIIIQQLRLAREAHRRLAELLQDPEGGRREGAPLEQLFAVYGPYWLPLLVPAVRALRLALTATK